MAQEFPQLFCATKFVSQLQPGLGSILRTLVECSYGKNQHSSGATSGYLMASLLLTSEAAPTDLLTVVIPPLAAGVAVVDDNVLLL